MLQTKSQASIRKQKSYFTLDDVIALQWLSHILINIKKKRLCSFVDFKHFRHFVLSREMV